VIAVLAVRAQGIVVPQWRISRRSSLSVVDDRHVRDNGQPEIEAADTGQRLRAVADAIALSEPRIIADTEWVSSGTGGIVSDPLVSPGVAGPYERDAVVLSTGTLVNHLVVLVRWTCGCEHDPVGMTKPNSWSTECAVCARWWAIFIRDGEDDRGLEPRPRSRLETPMTPWSARLDRARGWHVLS
jgi:hypothetical protein